MRRLFWVALGATAGILIVRKLTRTAKSLTPAGLLESVTQGVGDIADAIREFSGEVAAAMSEREAELMGALTDDGTELGAVPPDGTT